MPTSNSKPPFYTSPDSQSPRLNIVTLSSIMIIIQKMWKRSTMANEARRMIHHLKQIKIKKNEFDNTINKIQIKIEKL